MLTITLADLQTVRPVASNLGTDRLSMYIAEARRLDLQPLITAELMEKIDADEELETYDTLINGGTYTETEGGVTTTYSFEGLKKTLCYFVYARLIKANPVNVTAFGVVNKTDPNSERTEYKAIANMANEAYSIGTAYLDDCLLYISKQWPTQTTNEGTPQRKFKISPIGD